MNSSVSKKKKSKTIKFPTSTGSMNHATIDHQRSGLSTPNFHQLSPNTGNNFDGSPFSAVAGQDMLHKRHDRKRVESDLQLLANRIALLKFEEQRALLKVNETTARANEILEIKKRNEDFIQSKLAYKAQVEMEKRAAQRRAAAEREERLRRIADTKKLVYENRKIAAIQKKNESKQAEEVLIKNKITIEMEKRAKAEEARKLREKSKLLREQEKSKKEQMAQEYYIKKLEDERNRKLEAEKMIEILENEEKELITRLKRTQDLQKKAFSELQKSLET